LQDDLPEVVKKLNDKKVVIQYRNTFRNLEIAREKISSLVVNVSISFITYLLIELQKLKETIK